MNIIKKGEGGKVFFTTLGTKIIFDDMLMIDLGRYQRDEEIVVDISLNDNDMLQMGLGKWYVANVVIPGKSYAMVESEEKDENGNNTERRVAESLNMADVTLYLWDLPVNYVGGAF